MTEREALRKAMLSNPKGAREMMDMVTSGKIKVSDPDPDEELQVLCVRWPGLFDGCSREACMACGMDVAVAPSTRDMVANHKAPVQYVCVDCMSLPVH